ncbi:hypothetical protein BDK92_3036 [Micromonospora pisi]|uniref:Uncharacterized protein n=1 Tax=Micromonospora pisi TaxID=589240 RepID=A0A495JI68_9ACTN|nr:hypothetical protein [Micromonospora pisi]RKR88706.1 hypothetical protein BDK92_3036 [Micromonospora pisi]
MSHYASGESPYSGRPAGRAPTVAYSTDEWKLLIRLPGRVLVAATSPEPASPRHAVLEGLAGLEGIAAGRAFDSDLVRAVVVAIYAEPDNTPLDVQPDNGPFDGGPHAGRRDRLAGLLLSCQAAVEVLADRADPADSAAYRQWVQSVAARVRRAAHPVDAHLGTSGEWVPGIDGGFLGRLGTALGLR